MHGNIVLKCTLYVPINPHWTASPCRLSIMYLATHRFSSSLNVVPCHPCAPGLAWALGVKVPRWRGEESKHWSQVCQGMSLPYTPITQPRAASIAAQTQINLDAWKDGGAGDSSPWPLKKKRHQRRAPANHGGRGRERALMDLGGGATEGLE